jgi:hypothetical protein
MAQVPLHLMRDTITVNQRTSQPGIDGVPTAYASADITVMAYVQPLSGNDALQYMRDTTTEQWKVYCAPTATDGTTWDTSPKDKITWNSTVYKISGTPTASRGPDGTVVCVQFMMELNTA